jgi:hypothetical protein
VTTVRDTSSASSQACSNHRIEWIRQRLTAYFIGTEAPDTNKKTPQVTEGGYHDSGACHCVLFDAAGAVTRRRAIQRVREEFSKALGAFQIGRP